MAVPFLRSYAEWTTFIVITDHDSLRWILNLTEITSSVACWCLQTSEFEFNVVRRAGFMQQTADALLRLSASEEDNAPLEDDLLLLAIKVIQNFGDKQV